MVFLKSQQAAGNPIPRSGGVFFVSVSGERASDRTEMVTCAREPAAMATPSGPRAAPRRLAGFRRFRPRRFRHLRRPPERARSDARRDAGWIINVPSGCQPQLDEVKMRTEAVRRGVPMTTTLRGLRAAIDGLRTLAAHPEVEVLTLQEYHRATVRKGKPS